MPDWKKLVEQRLAALNLPPGDKADVLAELAAHLEDCDAADASTNENGNRALAEVPWRKLVREIERARREEGKMNRFTKILLLAIAVLFAAGLVLVFLDRVQIVQRLIWVSCGAMLLGAAASEGNRLGQRTRSLSLPALITFFGTSVSLMVCELLGMQPHILKHDKVAILWFYVPWLATLPVFGACGAFLSQRAHGSRSARLASALSPALIMLTVMLIILPWGLAIDGPHFLQLVGFGLGLLNWVVLPAAALMLGALPFLPPQPTQ